MGMKNILLVESDGLLRNTLIELLSLQGDFLLTESETGEIALNKLKEGNFDLLIIESLLPDMDGFELCHHIRRENADTPIIMLSTTEAERHTIPNPQAKPNEYITKPFRLRFLITRIQSQLRKLERDEDEIYSLGRYQFHPATKSLIEPKENEIIKLTEKETSILKYLFCPPNTFVGRARLLNEVWGYDSGVTTHTLETHVYRLRQKIEPDPSDAQILVTESGGYRLIP